MAGGEGGQWVVTCRNARVLGRGVGGGGGRGAVGSGQGEGSEGSGGGGVLRAVGAVPSGGRSARRAVTCGLQLNLKQPATLPTFAYFAVCAACAAVLQHAAWAECG